MIEEAYLSQFEKEMRDMSKLNSYIINEPEMKILALESSDLNDAFYHLGRNIRRMKSENFVKKADLLFGRITELKARYGEIMRTIREREIFQLESEKPADLELAKRVADNVLKKESEIKVSNKPKSKPKKKETKIKDPNQTELSIRGGARDGAGRPSLGKKKPVSITLEESEWAQIDELIKKAEFKSYADYFRFLSRVNGVLPVDEG